MSQRIWPLRIKNKDDEMKAIFAMECAHDTQPFFKKKSAEKIVID